MGIEIIENELPISQHSIGECCNCGKNRHIRRVLTYSAFGGATRGYYPFCFFCFGPVYRWKKTHLKESDTYETPHPREIYMPELEAAEHQMQRTASLGSPIKLDNIQLDSTDGVTK